MHAGIALHCIALHCIALHSITLRYISLHSSTLHYIALHYITLHYITLRYIPLHYITFHSIALHCMAWHGMAWHGMAWHGMAWHGIALHCIAYTHIIHRKGKLRPTNNTNKQASKCPSTAYRSKAMITLLIWKLPYFILRVFGLEDQMHHKHGAMHHILLQSQYGIKTISPFHGHLAQGLRPLYIYIYTHRYMHVSVYIFKYVGTFYVYILYRCREIYRYTYMETYTYNLLKSYKGPLPRSRGESKTWNPKLWTLVPLVVRGSKRCLYIFPYTCKYYSMYL